jgi:hypothetical protein
LNFYRRNKQGYGFGIIIEDIDKSYTVNSYGVNIAKFNREFNVFYHIVTSTHIIILTFYHKFVKNNTYKLVTITNYNSHSYTYRYHSYKGGFILRYFYETNIDKYIYYRIPKPLFTSIRYVDMSPMAKILYGIFLDRNSLSRVNGWVDEQGRVFFYFKHTEAAEMLNVTEKTVRKLMKELVEYELLEVVRQGCNLPNILYLGQYELST